VIALYRIAYRIQRIGEGIRDGFVAAIEEARPIFEDLSAAASHLWNELSKLFGGMSGAGAAVPSQQFADFGAIVGKVIGAVATFFVVLLDVVTWVIGGIVEGIRGAWTYIKDAFGFIRSAIGDLVESWDKLWGTQKKGSASTLKSASFMRHLGQVIGWLVGGSLALLAYALGMVIKLIDWLVQAIKWLVDKFVELDAKLAPVRETLIQWFTVDLPDAVGTALATVGGYFEVIGNFIAGIIKSVEDKIEALVGWLVRVGEKVGRIVDAVERGAGAVKNFAGGAVDSVGDFLGLGDDDEPATATAPSARKVDGSPAGWPFDALRNAAPSRNGVTPLPAMSPLRSLSEQVRGLAADQTPAAAHAASQLAALRELAMKMPAARAANEVAQMLQVAVQIDGETIARAVHRAAEDARARSFSPNIVPSL
jgi:hypothetical protein